MIVDKIIGYGLFFFLIFGGIILTIYSGLKNKIKKFCGRI
jgi:hypothetical protein